MRQSVGDEPSHWANLCGDRSPGTLCETRAHGIEHDRGRETKDLVLGGFPIMRRALMGFQAHCISQLDSVLGQVATGCGLGVLHQIGKAVRNRIQLMLDGLITSGLAVLQ